MEVPITSKPLLVTFAYAPLNGPETPVQVTSGTGSSKFELAVGWDPLVTATVIGEEHSFERPEVVEALAKHIETFWRENFEAFAPVYELRYPVLDASESQSQPPIHEGAVHLILQPDRSWTHEIRVELPTWQTS